jgi:hypothetical protein|tara:strand:- start:2011 stop:2196 length:186 start_codon:yes stop_codon:yes gene_type:complete
MKVNVYRNSDSSLVWSEPVTQKFLLNFYNQSRVKENGRVFCPTLKNLNDVEKYLDVTIERI